MNSLLRDTWGYVSPLSRDEKKKKKKDKNYTGLSKLVTQH